MVTVAPLTYAIFYIVATTTPRACWSEKCSNFPISFKLEKAVSFKIETLGKNVCCNIRNLKRRNDRQTLYNHNYSETIPGRKSKIEMQISVKI